MSALDPKTADLVRRLREWAGSYEEGSQDTEESLMSEAADALEAASPKGQVEPVAWADPRAIEKLKGTPATAVYLSKNGSAAYSMPLYAHKVPALTRDERQAAWASLRMIADAVGELFGPKASIESEDASLLRGPEFHHFAQGIVEALQRVAALSPAPSGGWQEKSAREVIHSVIAKALAEYEAEADSWQLEADVYAALTASGYSVVKHIRRDRPPLVVGDDTLPVAPSQVEG